MSLQGKKYPLLKFTEYLFKRGASPSTARQYTTAIRQLILHTEVDDAPGWTKLSVEAFHARAQEYYLTRSMAGQTQLSAAWKLFGLFLGVSWPPIVGDRRRAGVRMEHLLADPLDNETAEQRGRRAYLDRYAARVQVLAEGIKAAGRDNPEEILPWLYWGKSLDGRWCARDAERAYCWQPKYQRALEALLVYYQPAQEPPEGGPILLAKPAVQDPNLLPIEPEELHALLTRPVPEEVRKLVEYDEEELRKVEREAAGRSEPRFSDQPAALTS